MTITNWPHSIARPAIARMKAYSARGASTGALHLDANESPWSPPPSDNSVKDYNRYPAQQPQALKSRLASLYGTTPERLMIGRGADEAIDILLRSFCEARQDKVLICTPTFGYFKTAADIQGAGIIDVPLTDDFQWHITAIQDAIKSDAPKIAFLCSPNNPTGNSLAAEAVSAICNDNPETLIVVDEAYIEFSSLPSLLPLQGRYRNLVILRTLSKVYGLAGVRIGACIADPDIINLMLKVLPPYPIPRPVEKAVNLALAPAAMAVHKTRLTLWKAERKRVYDALKASPFVDSLYPSDANYILFKARDEDDMLTALSQSHIKIRDFRHKIKGHFRLSIGSPEENDIALTALNAMASVATHDRVGEEFRKTNETDIAVRVNLDNPHDVTIETGNGFFDHMLEQIAKHGGMGLTLTCRGDLEIDAHHTIEDTALAFGSALKKALGNKAGIGRYGFVMPMDETQARVAIDLSGRPAAVFKGEFPTDHVGEFPVEMCSHFFESLAQTLGAAIHIDVEGENSHHIIEACFKGVGRALRPAFARQGQDIPSTKGVL